ncbi:Hexosyltransferase [Fasciolopsis buskii]|uniref:Hexosyltransferase n=1 Tax=Fasciolopsis buskii TaxID=27845 RepID=A0A8E0RJZ1_9TREM|nr:Hexosyltransferase [Fasciolopsis buski]
MVNYIPSAVSHKEDGQVQVPGPAKSLQEPLVNPYYAKDVTLKPFVGPPNIEKRKILAEQQKLQNQPKHQQIQQEQHHQQQQSKQVQQTHQKQKQQQQQQKQNPTRPKQPVGKKLEPSQTNQNSVAPTLGVTKHKRRFVPFFDRLGHGKWSTRHCQRHSPYYSAKLALQLEGVQVGLRHAIKLFENFSRTSTTATTVAAPDSLSIDQILPDLCAVEQTQLLFVIRSDLQNTTQRDRIRRSWAALKYFNFDSTQAPTSTTAHGPSKVDYLFLVDFQYNQTMDSHQLDMFIREIQTEQDILPILLQPEDRRLYRGYLQAGEFVLSRCESRLNSVAFLTDSLMPNIPLLGSFIMEVNQPWGKRVQTSPMYCFTVEGERPTRTKKEVENHPDRVLVTRAEWSRPTFPVYCDLNAGGFVISMPSLQLWMSCALVYLPFPKLPHIYLTGILTEAAGVPVQRYWTTYGDPKVMLPSLGLGAQAGQHLFFTQTHVQPLWVWKSVFRSTLAEGLR